MNRRMLTGTAAAAVLLGGLAALQPAPAGEDSHGLTVRIGLVNSLFRDMPEPIMQIAMRPFKTILEAQTGVAGQIVAGGDAEALADQLKDDKVQLAVFHGVEFAWARQKQPTLKPLIIAVNQHHDLHALLVVRKDGKAAGCDDLKDRAVALPRLSREHCILFLERRCTPEGSTPGKNFSKVTTPGTAEEALDNVVDDEVQAAVIDAVDLEAYQKNKPGRAARLKTLLKSESFPCAVIAYNPGVLSDSMLQRFREGMIDAKSNEKGQALLKLCRITGFEDVPSDYEEMLTDISKAYPPPSK
jgi:ABC-type phosphate/phosphonate transport system substrate-binding protein